MTLQDFLKGQDRYHLYNAVKGKSVDEFIDNCQDDTLLITLHDIVFERSPYNKLKARMIYLEDYGKHLDSQTVKELVALCKLYLEDKISRDMIVLVQDDLMKHLKVLHPCKSEEIINKNIIIEAYYMFSVNIFITTNTKQLFVNSLQYRASILNKPLVNSYKTEFDNLTTRYAEHYKRHFSEMLKMKLKSLNIE